MSTAPTIPPPVWTSPGHGDAFEPLNEDVAAEVAVIGFGFVGLAAALELAEAGRSVILIDAGRPGSNASASSAGHVGPMMYGAKRNPDQVIAALGEEMGGRLNRLVAASGRRLFELIDQHGISCEARQGYVCVYRSEKGLARAAALFDRWRAFGGRSERLSRADLDRHVRSSRYAGGFFLPDGGFVNPAKLQAGLATALLHAGAAVHTGTRVTGLQRGASEWVLETPGGRVTAGQVIVAAGLGAGSILPDLVGTIYPVACGVAATAPLLDAGESLLPNGGPVADLEDPAIFAPAISDDKRLILSFLMSARRPALEHSARPAAARFARVFPEAPAPRFQSLSWGRIQLTPDGLPRLFQVDEGLYAVTGCNGLGLTLGMSAGRTAAQLVKGSPPGALALPVTSPAKLKGWKYVPGAMQRLMVPLVNSLGR